MAATLPAHIGIILDGNRRWAKQHGLPTAKGHQQGAETLKTVAYAAFEQGIQYLTAYVFSTENWQRSSTEVNFLMKLFVKAVELNLDEFDKNNIKIVIVGSRQGIANSVLKALDSAQQKTAANTKGTLALCLNYGGKQEVVDAMKGIVAGGVDACAITKDLIDTFIYEPTLPPLDLIIRTSGEQRLSGFMLWRSEYAELIFVDKLWPDFTADDLVECLTEYKTRQRRYGA